MAEPKPNFLDKFLEPKDEANPYTSERQHATQSFNLHVEWKDGRTAEGFAWSHYVGYRWADESEVEKLTVIFGERAVEIDGHNLGPLVREVREGQLKSIREITTAQCALLQHANPDNQPIIMAVKAYPDFDEMLMEIKGETNAKNRHSRRLER